MSPVIILAIGVAVVLGGIVWARLNAFIALIAAAIIVSLLAPGPVAEKLPRVVSAFGGTAGAIGVAIAMAAVIGKCMADSGAADRIVRFFVDVFGRKRSSWALAASGFVLSIPVFFDTVFYLLVPLARSMSRRLRGNYLLYLLAITAGAVATHTLVPPTPGPLVMADVLGVDIGVMMMAGSVVALPSCAVGMLFAAWANRRWPMDLVSEATGASEQEQRLPPLFWSAVPILLPIALVTTGSVLGTIANAERAARLKESDIRDWPALVTAVNGNEKVAAHFRERMPEAARELFASGAMPRDKQAAVTDALNEVLAQRDFYSGEAFQDTVLSAESRAMLKKNVSRLRLAEVERLNRLLLEDAFPPIARHEWTTPRRRAANLGTAFGNANLALLLAAAIAMVLLARHRRLTRRKIAVTVESALSTGAVIILITAAGGAFGAMLGKANVGAAIQGMFAGAGGSGVVLLLIGFGLASLLKFAQGSSTVAMITSVAMMSAMVDPAALPFHPVYLATAIGGGSLVGSWMNDSGFWIYCKMGGLDEIQALKTWTVLLALVGISSLVMTLILALTVPGALQ